MRSWKEGGAFIVGRRVPTGSLTIPCRVAVYDDCYHDERAKLIYDIFSLKRKAKTIFKAENVL